MSRFQRQPYYFVQGWGAPIHKCDIGARRKADMWKYFTPFPRVGVPDGYEYRRADYRSDYDYTQPFINKYRQVTESVGGRGSGWGTAPWTSGIRGFGLPTRDRGQCHVRRLCSLQKTKQGVGGRRAGTKYGKPYNRTGLSTRS